MCIRDRPESLPPSSEIIDGTCKSTIPRTGSLVAVVNHQKWLSLHSELTACDASTDAAPHRPGQSAPRHREASRLVSASTPYADGWLAADPDGSAATSIPTDEFRCGLQRRLGLWISAFVPAVRALLAAGQTADYLSATMPTAPPTIAAATTQPSQTGPPLCAPRQTDKLS